MTECVTVQPLTGLETSSACAGTAWWDRTRAARNAPGTKAWKRGTWRVRGDMKVLSRRSTCGEAGQAGTQGDDGALTPSAESAKPRITNRITLSSAGPLG